MNGERREVWYEGHVQGVGFRFTTQHLADRHRVTGFVRNLPDGRVHVVCEGDPKEVDGFLRDIDDRMGQYIHHTKSDRRPATDEFRRFEIRY